MRVLDQHGAEKWALYNGDCVEVVSGLPGESIDFSVFSPPYLSLYTYSNSPRDMGNNRSDDGFMEQFKFLVEQLFRVVKPGRVVAVDCMNVPMMKERDGAIGLKDFRGWLIASFIEKGFIFHSEHCMWKDPLIEATRTKALGLMHKQLCKDSTMCRAGIPQYILAFRKPGTNPNPVVHQNGLDTFYGEDEPISGNLSHERWRRYASPVWMDIDFNNTLNFREARTDQDERHICPMSLDAIARCMTLWSNRNDVVLSPFAGVGSEGYQAVCMGRRFVGVELKPSYYKQAIKNISKAENASDQLNLF